MLRFQSKSIEKIIIIILWGVESVGLTCADGMMGLGDWPLRLVDQVSVLFLLYLIYRYDAKEISKGSWVVRPRQ
ncbi:hypothetical protein [Saccharicrinis fermentans]|uniref:hypothetical protein n=1 Tax=Saccharicrinis fermentans TaxID=982 RepID=UPI0004BC044C|nr:hypothetical protein [Saccharicrinis fermentans]